MDICIEDLLWPISIHTEYVEKSEVLLDDLRCSVSQQTGCTFYMRTSRHEPILSNIPPLAYSISTFSAVKRKCRWFAFCAEQAAKPSHGQLRYSRAYTLELLAFYYYYYCCCC